MISQDYFNWIVDNYWVKELTPIANLLANKDYIWHMTLDKNRAHAGLMLRQQYACEVGVYYEDFAIGPCTCLEMITALAFQMWQQSGAKEPKYFIAEDVIPNFDRREISFDVLDRWMRGDYRADGYGSPFYIPNCNRDMRTMDVWSQMNLYLTSKYPLDVNFINSED